jgi:hypothetical protein
MTSFGGHYLPVGARRRVLSIYRDRRVRGDSPFGHGPISPAEAMNLTVTFFEGWLAHAVAYGVGEVQDWTDQLRAADFYRRELSKKPDSFRLRR